MTSRLFASLVFATSLAACVAPDEDPASDGADGKADGQATTIAFRSDWSEVKTGALVAGGEVRIQYSLDRLKTCRGTSGGSDVWGVSGYASFDGAAPVTFAVSRLDSGGHVQPLAATVAIPSSAKSVAFWFAINNRWGCIAYDSNDNANYTYSVTAAHQGAVLAFNADWSETQSEAIRGGDQVVVHYDPSRLAQCAGSSGGNAVWGVTAYYQVDGGATKTVMVSRSSGTNLVPSDPVITVGHGHDLAMWFTSQNIWGCHAYDSNLDSDYHFTIE